MASTLGMYRTVAAPLHFSLFLLLVLLCLDHQRPALSQRDEVYPNKAQARDLLDA